MPRTKSSMPTSIRLGQALWNDRALLVATAVSLMGIYSFALREPFSVANCHTAAQETARNLMLQRANQNPSNTQLAEAAKANLYANEDYNPQFRNCMLDRGYQM